MALHLVDEAHKQLGECFPDLILTDSLYFTKTTFKKVRSKDSHILIKSSSPQFRSVLQDAQFLFEHHVTTRIERKRGFDSQRWCNWSIEKARGEFTGYPIQIAHVVEDYPKRTQNSHTECWTVTTNLSLSCRAIREAAHLRWHIENNVFKRISHLSATKRFNFKDPRRFSAMLRLFFAALAALYAYICIMRRSQQKFKRMLNGIRPTWKNIFSRLRDQLEDAAFRW